MTFRISSLDRGQFSHLFDLDDAALAGHGAVRRTAATRPGYPCRVSLADAEVGEEVLLVHFEHQSAASPFRASHAVYVRPGAARAFPAVDDVPDLLRTRLLSLRAFDGAGMMVDADVVDGADVEALITRMLADPAADYLHIHFARPGCYAARVDRA